MSDKQGISRTIHPNALRDIGEEACMTLLGIARDLRDGTIPPEKYDQRTLGHGCNTPCCIAGHFKWRAPEIWQGLINFHAAAHTPLDNLFDACYPSDPMLAAKAIDRYVFDYSNKPWMY